MKFIFLITIALCSQVSIAQAACEDLAGAWVGSCSEYISNTNKTEIYDDNIDFTGTTCTNVSIFGESFSPETEALVKGTDAGYKYEEKHFYEWIGDLLRSSVKGVYYVPEHFKYDEMADYYLKNGQLIKTYTITEKDSTGFYNLVTGKCTFNKIP